MSLITPLLVQITLTFIIMFTLIRYRVPELNSKRVNPDDVPLRQGQWPEKASLVDSNFLSQFEMPLLFMGLVILHVVTKSDDQIQLYLAWAFVVGRILHAIFQIVIRNNNARTLAFALSSFSLMAMWIRFALAFYA